MLLRLGFWWGSCSVVTLQAEEIWVVVHPQNPLTQLEAQQVADLFLGRSQLFPNGQRAEVIEQRRDSRVREAFFLALDDMPLAYVNAYWARLQFSGRVRPPQALEDSLEVVEVVANNPAAVGYIATSLPQSLLATIKPVLRLNQ
ncbi:hypothetical protein D5085_03910 [Ectothiorhodospiraceae bacterium BW-2]|nr:hypothetical protein D5085_03910 [Ectothiorhodospiraceae bacterium BW-2]